MAAMDALAGLDAAPVRLSSAADAAEIAATKLEQAAKRAEAAAARVETNSEIVEAKPEKPKPKPRPVQPIVDPIIVDDTPPPRIKSRIPGIIGLLVIIGLIGGGVYFYLKNKEDAEAEALKKKQEDEKKKKEAEELSKKLSAAQVDPGAIKVRSTPSKAGVWLKIGRSPVTSMSLSSAMMHELRVEGVAGYQAVDTQVVGAHWSGENDKRAAKIVVELRPVEKDRKGKEVVKVLPPTPPKPPDATGFVPGRGPIAIETQCVDGANKKPCDAEVWLYIGLTDQVDMQGIPAGRPYELKLLVDGYLPKFVSITADEWRDPKGNPKDPIDMAKKLSAVEKSVTLDPDPNAPKKKGQ
jgi:hypothetical protein